MTTEPRLIRSTFILDFDDVTGPPFRPYYARVDMLSRTAEVTVRLRDGEPHASTVKVYGDRAKKDGTASLLSAEAEYFFLGSYSMDTPPPHIMAAAQEAERLVRGMISGMNEVTV